MCRNCTNKAKLPAAALATAATTAAAAAAAACADGVFDLHKVRCPAGKRLVALQCSVDLLSLVEVLETPREYTAVITVLDSIEPNSGTSWYEEGARMPCAQMLFFDTRKTVRSMMGMLYDMTLVNHSTDYNMLPVRFERLPADQKKRCCCGTERCDGSAERRRIISATQRMRAPTAAVRRVDAQQSTPPNCCCLTFRETTADGGIIDSLKIDRMVRCGATLKRPERLHALREQLRNEYLFFDRTRIFPLVPNEDDVEPVARTDDDTDETYQRRVNERYARYATEPPCCVVNNGETVPTLKFDCSVHDQRNSLLAPQRYDADALEYIRSKSPHCAPLCYRRVRSALVRLVKKQIPVEALMQRAADKEPRYGARVPQRRAGDRSDSDDSSDSDVDDNDDDDTADGSDDTVEYDGAEDHDGKQHPEPAFIDVDDKDGEPDEARDAAILKQLEARFAQSVQCSGASDCTCFSSAFIRSHVSTAYCISMIALSTAAVYGHLGDSVYSVESPAMCEIAALDCAMSKRFVENAATYWRALGKDDGVDSTLDQRIGFITTMKTHAAALRQTVYRTEDVLADRQLHTLMQKQLGQFTPTRVSGGVELLPRGEPNTSPHHAFQSFMAWTLAKYKKPTEKRVRPFGNVFGNCIRTDYAKLLATARRFYPIVESRCLGLSDFVYQLGWYANSELFASLDDWLPPYVRLYVHNGVRDRPNVAFMFARMHETHRPLLALDVEQRIVGELQTTRNVRLVIARLSAYFLSKLGNIVDFYVAVWRALLIVGVCKLCNEIADRMREEALRELVGLPPSTRADTIELRKKKRTAAMKAKRDLALAKQQRQAELQAAQRAKDAVRREQELRANAEREAQQAAKFERRQQARAQRLLADTRKRAADELTMKTAATTLSSTTPQIVPPLVRTTDPVVRTEPTPVRTLDERPKLLKSPLSPSSAPYAPQLHSLSGKSLAQWMLEVTSIDIMHNELL